MVEKISKSGMPYILLGVALFILRYIPLYQVGESIFSLDSASGLCNSFLGYTVDQCNWVKPLNTITNVVSIALIVYGAYFFYLQKKK